MLKTILVVEDEEEIRNYLKKFLRDNGYAVLTAQDGAIALKVFRKTPPDLVVLDLNLPTLSGETVCIEMKKDYPEIPVIMLTAKSKSTDVMSGFKLGADDYVSKPFDGDELMARIKARLKVRGKEEVVLKVDNLELDSLTFEARRNGKTISLTQKEFELLHYLMSNSGRVLTRDMILNKVWLYSPDIESRVVDVYVGYLRKKVDSGHKKKLIQSLRGFGYVLKS